MAQKLTISQHYQSLGAILREDWLYVFNLNFLLTINALVVGGPILLTYLAAVPWWVALAVDILGISWLTIVFTGVAKNLHALALERGAAKYPLLALEYFYLGLPVVLAYVIIDVLPFLLVVAAGLFMRTHAGLGWEILLVAIGCRLAISWWWGLAPATMLAHRQNFWTALINSGVLVARHWWRVLLITLCNQLILLLGLAIPVIGWWLAFDWLIMSACRLERLLSLEVRLYRLPAKKPTHQVAPTPSSRELLSARKTTLQKQRRRRETIYKADSALPAKKTTSVRAKTSAKRKTAAKNKTLSGKTGQ